MGPHGEHDHEGGWLAWGVGSGLLLLIILAALATTYLLWRQGRLPRLPLARPARAEDGAKQILAERFARGDIGSEEFLERASYLNWTPGTDPLPVRRRP